MPGVVVTLTHEKTQDNADLAVRSSGLADYLTECRAVDQAEPLIPLFEGEHYAEEGEAENNAEGEGAAWCVAFTEDGATLRESYVNLIPTVAGGTHEAGLKRRLVRRGQGLHRACIRSCPRASS